MLLNANAESGTSGSALVAGSDFDLVTVGSGGSAVYDSANAILGSLAYKITSGSVLTYVGWSTSLGGSVTDLYGRVYCKVPTAFTAPLIQLRSGGSLAGKISLTVAGKIQLLSGAGSVLVTSSSTYTAGTAFRLEFHAVASASTTGGTLEVRIFANKDSTTITETLGPFTATQTASNFDQCWFGPSSTTAGNIMYLDEVAVNDTGWLGPQGSVGVAPAVVSNPPRPTGDTYVGATLMASSPGEWTGSPPPTFTYQWRRCDSSGANAVAIAGATADTYTLTSADLGSTIRIAVTGTNASGNATTASTYTAVITNPPSTSFALNNNADGTNGVAVTGANSGGQLGDAWDVLTITAGGSIAYDSSTKAHGTASMKFVAAGAAAYLGWSSAILGSQTDVYIRFYVRMTAYPSAGAALVKFYQSGTASASLNITNGGLLRIRNGAGTAIASGTTVIPLNKWVRIEAHMVASTTSGSVATRLYLQQDSTITNEALSATNQALSATVDQVTFGLINNATAGDTIWFDELATDNGWIGPVSDQARRWGWGMVAAPGLTNIGGGGGGGPRTAADVMWGFNLYSGYGPYFGTNETADQLVARQLNDYGRVGMSKCFPNTISTFNYNLEGKNPSQRAAVCTRYDQVALASGTYDTTIRNYVRSIPAGWYIILVNWQEPDSEMLKDGVFTPAQHVAASNHMADIVHDEIANGRLNNGVTCEVWDCFENFTMRGGYGGWNDSYAALNTDGIAWDVYGNPPPGARIDKTAGSRTPITGSSYGVGSTNYDPAMYVSNLKTVATRLGFSKWGVMEVGAPFRQGDVASVTGKPDGYYRAEWFGKFCDAIIDQGAMMAMVFNAMGTGFDQRLINYPASSYTGNYTLLNGVSWNPSPRPTSNEEPAIATLRQYFQQSL